MTNILVWDIPARLLHWAFAASLGAALAISLLVDKERPLFQLHMLLGIVAVFLLVVRILLGLIGSRYSRFASFPVHPRELASYLTSAVVSKTKLYAGNNPGSAMATVLMFLLVPALFISGIGYPRQRKGGAMPLMFELQPRESDKAFAAFKTYLELGPERSLVAVAVKVGKNRSLLERWSRKFDWPARVQAHTAHLADIERKTAESLAVQAGTDWAKRQEQHREDEWQNRSELIALAREAIDRWKKNPVRCGTLEGIARLLDLASKLGRVSSGLSLEPVEKPGESDAAFMIQIEVALEKIYGQPEAGRTVASPQTAIVEVEPINPPAALVAAPLANSQT